MLPPVDLNHVTVSVTDIERSVEFYKRLGLRQIVASYPTYARFACPAGDSTLSLHGLEAGAELPQQMTTIHFECDDVDAQVAALKEWGIEFDMEPTDQPYLWREAILRDPDGNVIFLFHAGENRLDPPWRLDRE
jgi:catechol 2,3-dioxygenase-like lactoylglutathione lyase family enzyme